MQSTYESDVPLPLLEGEFDVFFNDETKVAIALITNVTSAILVLDYRKKYDEEKMPCA